MLPQQHTSPVWSVYSNPAYPHRVHLQAPFREVVLIEALKSFMSSMSASRIAVEWLFGDIINYFKFLDYKEKLILE